MRLIVKTYDDDTRSVLETENDGSAPYKYIKGATDAKEASEKAKRISVYMEVMCDDNPKGADRLLSDLDWLIAEAKKRKLKFASKTKAGSSSPA